MALTVLLASAFSLRGEAGAGTGVPLAPPLSRLAAAPPLPLLLPLLLLLLPRGMEGGECAACACGGACGGACKY